MTPSDERRHLDHGPDPGEQDTGVGPVSVTASGPDPAGILDRSREVLRAVLDASGGPWPDLAGWQARLPDWFVAASAPEQTPEQAAAELARWRSMSAAERAAAEDDEAWTLSDWIHWLQPAERQWYWWSARVRDPGTAEVAVSVPGWPAPLGALEWLLRAAGASTVDY